MIDYSLPRWTRSFVGPTTPFPRLPVSAPPPGVPDMLDLTAGVFPTRPETRSSYQVGFRPGPESALHSHPLSPIARYQQTILVFTLTIYSPAQCQILRMSLFRSTQHRPKIGATCHHSNRFEPNRTRTNSASTIELPRATDGSSVTVRLAKTCITNPVYAKCLSISQDTPGPCGFPSPAISYTLSRVILWPRVHDSFIRGILSGPVHLASPHQAWALRRPFLVLGSSY